MCLDDDPMGLLFVIPTLFAPVCDLFEVPESLKADKGLVAVLVPWTLSIDEVKKLDWKLPLNELAERTTPRISLPEPLQFRNLPSRFYYALRVLKFPSELLHWMTISVHPRPYCICHAVGDGKKKNPGWDRRKQEEPGVETMLLRMVLDECPGSTDKGYNKAVKAIFVHIGSLWSISKAGAVNGRRAKEPDVRIFTYGTHESISPDRWGFKEVYPVGE